VESVRSSWVYAVARSGALKWKEQVPEGCLFVQQVALYTIWGTPPTDHLLLMVNSATASNGLYSINSSGNWGPSFLLENNPLCGVAVDRGNHIFVRALDGSLYKLDSGMNEIWKFTLSSVPSTEAQFALSIGPDGTAYVATSEPRLFAIAEDALGLPFEKWSYRNEFYALSEPVFGKDGEIYLFLSNKATVALDASDASELWRQGLSHTWVSAMTVLEDGTVVAAANSGHHLYDDEGVNVWSVRSVGSNSAVIGKDGMIVVTGQVDHNITNAIFAYQWRLAHGAGWYRGNGDNANTRWAVGASARIATSQ